MRACLWGRCPAVLRANSWLCTGIPPGWAWETKGARDWTWVGRVHSEHHTRRTLWARNLMLWFMLVLNAVNSINSCLSDAWLEGALCGFGSSLEPPGLAGHYLWSHAVSRLGIQTLQGREGRWGHT